MADDIQVRFGGDASGIRAAAQQAKAAVQDQAAATQAANLATAQALRDLSAEMRATRDAMQAQVAAAQQTAAATARIAAATREASDWQTDLKARLEQTTLGYIAVKAVALEAAATVAVWNAAVSIDRSAASSWGALPGQIHDAAVAARDYFTSVAYAEHGGRLFAQANEGVRASIGRMILDIEQFVDRMRASSAEIARNQIVAISAAEGLERFRTALGLTDSGAKDVLLRFTAELQKIPGLSREAAAGIEVMLATVPNYSVDTNAILVNLLQTISRTGDEAVANARKIGAAFKDQQNGGRILGDLTADLRNLEDIQVLARRIAASLTPQQAISYFDTIETRLKKQAEQQAFIAEENDKAIRRYPLIGTALADINERLYGAQAAQRSLNEDIRVATLELQTQRREREGIVAAQQREVDAQKAINFESSQAGRLQQSEAASTLLRGRLDTGADAASRMTPAERDLMIRTVYGEAGAEGAEGQEAVANVIRNRVLSGRYGGSYQDVITAPRQFSVWNPGDPAGNTARNLSADSEAYRRIGEIVDKVSLAEAADPTRGATNYYNPRAADPAWGRTLGNVTDIGNHRFGNTPDSPPVGDDAQQDAIRQRLEEQADVRRRIADEQRGGTRADVESLAIAQEAVATARNQVEEARRLVEARKDDERAAQGGTPAARLAAARAVAEAEQTLRDRQRAQEQSEIDLRVAGMETSSAERVRIVNEEVTKQQAAYARGSAEWNRLELQKTNNLRAQEKAAAQEAESLLRARVALKTVGSDNSDPETAKARIAMLDQLLAREEAGSLRSIQLAREKAEIETALERASAAERASAEDTAYQNARRLLDDRIKDIRAEASERQISFEERRTQTLAVLAEIEALERGHQERLKQIWGEGTSQYRQAKAQLLQLDGQSAARRAQAEREVNKAVYQDTRRSYEQIGATLTGNTFAVLQGQQTVAQAARATAMSIIQSYVQAKVRLAADWLAGVTTHQAGEAAKTAATVAGVTARTGAEEAGAATSLATQGGAMIKSIMASAAETFAGIFGFLSPLMGPAAAGPALAGEATVAAAAAAIPSFAVGAWALPGDTLANVHRGEMIVPAAATPWAQSLMAQAAGGKAGSAPASAGDVHFHVSAVDAAGVKAFFRANARHIMEAINDGVRTGSHLGLSKLRT
ncbi:cell wall hydrolase [Methylobacterium currus]|uniref:cell wall hydrolase n=1 Tax=Methylobacterium currus TaxID=2051553 RepID=UPI001E3AF83F|nr:cell wall hydrolase [Methylobacterium currus]UHC16069.1 cell wall hydrolase [Methylobacterium currus]